MEYLLLYLLAAAVGLLVTYWIIRAAVISALRVHAVWEAKGGVQALIDADEFARTGIRPQAPTE